MTDPFAGPVVGSSNIEPGSRCKSLGQRLVVLVPVAHHIEPATEACLHTLEGKGIAVWRLFGCSDIARGRSEFATQALEEGFEAILWVDSDMVFSADDVIKLWNHNLPIVGGIYSAKGIRRLSVVPLTTPFEFVFGIGGGLVEVRGLGTGLLMVRRIVFDGIQSCFNLPRCRGEKQCGIVPYFNHLIEKESVGGIYSFLSEDLSFCERARRAGFQVMADTSIRLGHLGMFAYSYEDQEVKRYATYKMTINPDPSD